ncbi:MAG: hypothetical protein AAFR91_13835 [Pseudomonadota bacterium]
MNERYIRERAQTDLALTMIRFEARTSTIRSCTGLSDDRIRKLCQRYFTGRNGSTIRRRRGKSPRQLSRFVKNPAHQLEATTLMHLFVAYGLIAVDDGGALTTCWKTPTVNCGHRFCAAYAAYREVHEQPLFSFEWAWTLMLAVERDDMLALIACGSCDTHYLHDRYALDFHVCPACEIRTERRRRPGARQFVSS